MADNVKMRDYDGLSKTMRTTDKGTAHVPHHITDGVSLVPVLGSASALVNGKIVSAAPAALINLDAYLAADGYLCLFDDTAIPASAAAYPATLLKIWKVFQDQHFSYTPPNPIKCVNLGIVIAFSTTAFPANWTRATQAFISAEIGAVTGEAS